MNRLRTTFKRSRTPTGAEMKTQSSLEVPKQVRSASFDEIQLEAKRQNAHNNHQANALTNNNNPLHESTGGLLRVPHNHQYPGQRSRSVDSAASAATAANSSDEGGNFLDVPRRFQRRRSSGSKTPYCVHCVCLEEYKKACAADRPPPEPPDKQQQQGSSLSMSDDTLSLSGDEDDEEEEADEEEPVPECCITVTLSPTIITAPPLQSPPPLPLSPTIECFPAGDDLDQAPSTPSARRKSIHRQEAFFAEPTGTSLENMSQQSSDGTAGPLSDVTSEGALSEGDAAGITIPGVRIIATTATTTTTATLVVSDIYLQVPDLRRDRAASVDSCFSKVSQGKTEELQHSGVSLEVPVGPNVALRSRSVDIVLPTDQQARYKALAMAAPPSSSGTSSSYASRRKSGTESTGAAGGGGGERVLRSTPDWSEGAINGDHLWVPTSVSGDFCYVGDTDCTKHGPRLKCSACNVITHQSCINNLIDKIKFTCKSTFRDVGIRQYREQTCIHHHWVHRRSEKGKCRQCGKSFQSKLSFSNKEIVALSCSWCKAAYHNKESCFNIQRIGEECRLGVHSSIIVPPSWIVKLPRKGSFKSSLRKSPKKRPASKKRSKEKDKDPRTFVLKPIPSTTVRPVIVFINPKSGGNQGAKLLQKFQWLLNPRQVFDLTQGGPQKGLEVFRKVPNLRVLACGGDGTVGWILSVIDQIGMTPAPAVGVLPLGTGNDLARALGWGGGYTDEPISKILTNIGSSDTLLLDRWSLAVEKNPDAVATNDANDNAGKDTLPLNVVNNYFSLGVDAHIALEFHEAREAHPEKFNSRLRNKMFYGQMGGKDLLKRKWKGLAELVTLECDGKDLTPKLKELKVHAVVFLNIPSYGGGTHPWNRSMGSVEPSTEDGLIEVVGLTTYQLPLLQAGGHGTCITQCRQARIVTSKTIPMQVDGEACKLAPSIIQLSLLNQATMLAKRKGRAVTAVQAEELTPINIQVCRVSMADYEQHHYDKELLAQAAQLLGQVEVNPVSDLEQVRLQVNKSLGPSEPHDWCFVDSCTAERFFRIDRAQENLHYISDIATDILYLLDCEGSGAAGAASRTGSGDSGGSIGGVGCGGRGSPGLHEGTAVVAAVPAPYVIPEMKVSDEGSLDSPSDHPPMSPKVIQSPDDEPVTVQNGERPPHLPVHPNLKLRSSPNDKPSDTLLKAARIGDLPMIKDLHAQGYSLLSKDTSGQTVLHLAARFDHRDLVKYLLGQAPSVLIDMRDAAHGQTALHKAAAYKCRTVCCMLVAGGASLTVSDHGGRTARVLAIQAEDHELAAYLESQEQFQSTDYGTVV